MGDGPVVRGVSHVSLSVRSLERSLVFYRDVLGLEVFVEPFDGVVFEDREAMVAAGRVIICLQAHDANSGERFDPTRTGLDHLALHVSDRDVLGRWDERLTTMDVDHSPVKQAGRFGWMIELRDPDGLQIELFTPE